MYPPEAALPELIPAVARYIKLGSAKEKATAHAVEVAGEAFVHFGTNDPEAFGYAAARDWDSFRAWRLRGEESRVARGEITRAAAESNATAAKNQVKAFVEDDGHTLWFTFHESKLYWAFLDPVRPTAPDTERGFVRGVREKWRCTDVGGKTTLHFDDLSGRLTRTAAYRSTTCTITKEAREYLWRRLRGENPVEATRAQEARTVLLAALVKVIEKFTFKDFELLAELVFTSVGWRRLSLTGSAMPFVDTILEQPLDRRVVGVQVKSVLKAGDLKVYGQKFEHEYSVEADGMFHAVYFVYHSDPDSVGPAYEAVAAADGDAPLLLMGPEKIADLALRAGLADWVIERIM
ncbi:MAG: hypothetical protein EXR71_00005 [Myxococcales bacterium]|nr:hypothetical protein [Myxococcales bacterium]